MQTKLPLAVQTELPLAAQTAARARRPQTPPPDPAKQTVEDQLRLLEARIPLGRAAGPGTSREARRRPLLYVYRAYDPEGTEAERVWPVRWVRYAQPTHIDRIWVRVTGEAPPQSPYSEARALTKFDTGRRRALWRVEARRSSYADKATMRLLADRLAFADLFRPLAEPSPTPANPRKWTSEPRLTAPATLLTNSLDALLLALSPARSLGAGPNRPDPLPAACLLASLGCDPYSDDWDVHGDLAAAFGLPFHEHLALLARVDPWIWPSLHRLSRGALR